MHRFAALLAVMALALSAAPMVSGQSAPPARDPGLKSRLDGFEPEERRKLVESLKRWRTMTEEERQAIRDKLEAFKTLPEDEKKSLSERLKKWKSQDQRSKGELGRRYDDLRQLPVHEREALASRLRLFANLPPAEQERISGLPEQQRRVELERMFQIEEIARLSRSLTPGEREEIRSMPPAEQRERILSILRERKAENLSRMPEAVRVHMESLPRKEKASAEEKFLRDLAWRDQKVAMVLPRGQRQRFSRIPPAQRDVYALRFIEENGERLFSRIPAQSRSRVESADAADRPWLLLDEVFQTDLVRIQSSLLPSQLKSLKDAPPQKAWEKTRGYLDQNHRRLLQRLPREFRERLETIPAGERAQRIRAYLESELDKLPLDRLQKAGIRDLPPALMIEAIARYKKTRKAADKSGK